MTVVKTVLSWFFGILFLLMGVITVIDSPVVSIPLFGIAILILPVTGKKIPSAKKTIMGV